MLYCKFWIYWVGTYCKVCIYTRLVIRCKKKKEFIEISVMCIGRILYCKNKFRWNKHQGHVQVHRRQISRTSSHHWALRVPWQPNLSSEDFLLKLFWSRLRVNVIMWILFYAVGYFNVIQRTVSDTDYLSKDRVMLESGLNRSIPVLLI